MENMPRKFIDFIITQKCTYRCEYCSQSKNENCVQNEADDNTICAFLNFLKNLDKDFEIMITGGEAILHKNFFDLIEKIKKLGFKINLISNFSFVKSFSILIVHPFFNLIISQNFYEFNMFS